MICIKNTGDNQMMMLNNRYAVRFIYMNSPTIILRERRKHGRQNIPCKLNYKQDLPRNKVDNLQFAQVEDASICPAFRSNRVGMINLEKTPQIFLLLLEILEKQKEIVEFFIFSFKPLKNSAKCVKTQKR